MIRANSSSDLPPLCLQFVAGILALLYLVDAYPAKQTLLSAFALLVYLVRPNDLARMRSANQPLTANIASHLAAGRHLVADAIALGSEYGTHHWHRPIADHASLVVLVLPPAAGARRSQPADLWPVGPRRARAGAPVRQRRPARLLRDLRLARALLHLPLSQ